MNKKSHPNFRSGKAFAGRDRFLHVSAQIIPKGTQIGVDKNTKQPILTDRNLVAKGNTYVKPVEDVAA